MLQARVHWFPEKQDTVHWAVKEVVRDVGGRPQLFLRLEISGVFFPERALHPYVRVGRVRSLFALIDPDGDRVRAYFNRSLPAQGEIVFGYGRQVVFRLSQETEPVEIRRLDHARLPKGTRMLRPPEE